MKLRDYQDLHITALAQALRVHRKVAAQLATGGGKTVEFCSIANRYISKSAKSVLILVHRQELLDQTRRTAYNLYGMASVAIVAGMKHIPDAPLYVGMVESVMRRIPKIKNVGMVIIDEAHIASFNKIHEHFPTQYIIGFTATPLSASKKRPMNLYYEEIVCGVDIPQLISEGHLCQNITWAPKDTVDRLTLQMASNGLDFDDTMMAQAFSKPRYIHNTVTAYEKWAKGTKTMVFNVNVDHSKAVCEAFVEAGYNARHLDATSSDRKEILEWFKQTPDAVLCNVAIATTGFDEPTVESVIVNKATQSMPLWLQICGRGGRPIDEVFIANKQKEYQYELSPKRAFTIIDMGGNAVTHGDWCQSRDWKDIFHNPPKVGKATAAPVKSCPSCDAIVAAGARKCHICGYEWPAKDISVEVDLHEFIVVTKGIDVQQVIETNKDKKIYYAFFLIGKKLSEEAKNTIPGMTDEYFEFITGKYFELGKQWTKAHKKRFNEWHRQRAVEILLENIQKHFPTWRPSETILASLAA